MPDGRGHWTALFDVCDTLFAANTTIGFLRFHARRSGDAYAAAVLDRWTSRRSVAFYAGAAVYKLCGWDLPRRRLLRILRGQSRAMLEQAASEYFQVELADQAIGPVQQRLEEHRRHGDRVLLISNGLDIVVGPIACELGVEWLASKLEFKDGRCTGRLARDLTGCKSRAAASLVESGERLHVYTDNRSDRDLLRLAGRRTIILRAGDGHWAGQDCEYLEV
jgi:HAD superfamily phosphoserine phosphatase-like hydrolase